MEVFFMNSKKIYLLCSLSISSFSIIFAQPKSKYSRHVDRKLSKKDLRMGLDRHQQQKQAAWELMQAKQRHKEDQKYRSVHTKNVKDVPHEYIPALDLFTPYESYQAYGSCYKGAGLRSVTAIMLCTLLFFAPCDALRPIRYKCINIQNHINANKEHFVSIREFAKEHKNELGNVQFPETIELSCPPIDDGLSDRHWRDDHAYDWAQKGQAFLDAFEQSHQELNKRIDAHNKPIKENQQKAQVHSVLSRVYEYIGKKIGNLKSEYKLAFDVYAQNSDLFV